MSPRPRPWLPAAVILAGIVGGLALAYAARESALYDLMADQEHVRTWVEGFGPWGPLVIIVLEMVQVLLAPIPGQAVGVAAGYLFGPWLGILYVMIGLVIGSIIGFGLARLLGRPLVRRLAPVMGARLAPALSRLDALAPRAAEGRWRGGSLFFFLLWLFPFVPDDLACLAAGLTPMPFRHFLILMPLGRLPGVAFSVWIGARAASLSPTALGVVLVGLALVAVLLWRWGRPLQAAVLGLLSRLATRRP